MARAVSSLLQALDAAIAGEEGHKQVNALLMLEDIKIAGKRFTDAELDNYWRLRAAIGKAISTRTAAAEGDEMVSELLRLYTNVETIRGVTHPAVVEVVKHERDLFWVLRSRIADDIEATG